MDYQTFEPSADLASLIKFYWTLEVPYDPQNSKQKIIPDGCVEMTFNLADPIKRYTSENEFLLHPCAMVMGQRTKSYYIEPTGDVKSFAICFYPYGFANFVRTPLKDLLDVETPLSSLFGEPTANDLEQQMINASDTDNRIQIIESFLLSRLKESDTIQHIVKSTVDMLLESKGSLSINSILENQSSNRRQLERSFAKQIGISPKQLGKAIRLQTALNLLLNNSENLTNVAYESEYFDQAHFIKDFKEFMGITPKEYLGDEHMRLSRLFYK